MQSRLQPASSPERTVHQAPVSLRRALGALPIPPVLVLMALVGLTLSCDAAPSKQAPPPAPVRIETVVERDVPRVSEYVGTVRSRDATDIRAQITGRITAIAVTAGQTVHAGEMLMRIDQGRQQAMLSRAKAASASATSDLERARADLASLAASRDAAASRAQFAAKQRERVRALFAADNASREAYERASTEAERAEAELVALDAQQRAQRAAIESLEAAVSESRSSVREGQAELSYYNVEAPIDGRLGDIPVRVGDLVTPSTLLTSLEGNSSREVYVQVPVDKRRQLQPGLRLQIVDNDDNVLTAGDIAFISPQVDTLTQTVLVKAPLSAASPVAPGQYVRARVVWERAHGPTLPPAAVQRINTQPFAFVLTDAVPPTVRQVPITLGPLYEDRYLVERGLTVGQRVVVAGIQRLRDGAVVAIEEAPAAGPVDDTDSVEPTEPVGPVHPAEPAAEGKTPATVPPAIQGPHADKSGASRSE